MEQQLAEVKSTYESHASWGWNLSAIDLRDVPDPLKRLTEMFDILSPTRWGSAKVKYDDLASALEQVKERDEPGGA